MDAHKRYTIFLISFLAAVMLILVIAGFYIEPLIGDLTRVGGYAEKDFGWNQPQQVFEKAPPPLRRHYDDYADVLVLGDSFSFSGVGDMLNFPWQTFLTLSTGLSTTTITHYSRTDPPEYGATTLPNIVNSPTFQNTPPRVFVLEIIERQLKLLPDYPGTCRPESKIEHKPEFNLNSNTFPLKTIQRRAVNQPTMQQHVAYVSRYLSELLSLKKEKNSKVYQLELTNPLLFSNKLSDQLLVFEGDVARKHWNEQQIASIHCKLINAQNLVQKNGKTLFLAMIVPDKLTVYSRFLKDQSYADESIMDSLATDPALHLPRIDQAINSALEAGVVDLYLPNDLHWGYRTHKAAAKVLSEYMANFKGD